MTKEYPYRFNSFHTKELSQDIANWFNHPDNKGVFNLSILSLKIGISNKRALDRLCLGEYKSLKAEYISKLLPIIKALGFTSKYLEIKFEAIEHEVCSYYKISTTAYKENNRHGDNTLPKYFVIKFAKDILSMSNKALSKELNDRNPSTIQYGKKTINTWIQTNYEVRKDYEELKKRLIIH